ncbi:hypothetical protein ACFCY8_10655 [Streptomyces noursei]|uniref:hypothetical protein n=1 Tax=Streptomyces noursei TaxID=1971 RepID=UPI0035E36169
MPRGQLVCLDGYHRARTARIAERLMGMVRGSAHERASDVWGEAYGKTLGTLLVLEVTRPGWPRCAGTSWQRPRNCRFRCLAALADRARPWRESSADPSATMFFFRSGPAAAWYQALKEHAEHLLLSDESTGVAGRGSGPRPCCADAAAGLPLAERMRAWPRIAAAEAQLHARLVASHLAAFQPAVGDAPTFAAATGGAAGAGI